MNASSSSASSPSPVSAEDTAHAEPPPPPPRRRGRPARAQTEASPAARDRILSAARGEFAEHGYDKTSIRGIAKSAGVDPALVHHYFGTKEQVFAAAIELIFAPAMGAPEAVHSGDRDGVGERMARFLFGVWDDPVTRQPLLVVMRSALTNETAAVVLRRMIERRLLLRMAGELDVPDPEFRAQLAAAHLIGIAMLRYVIKMDPLASVDLDKIVAMVGPTLQRYLTES